MNSTYMAPTKKRPERRSSKEFCRDIKKPRRVGEVLHAGKSAPFRGECQHSLGIQLLYEVIH